MSSLVSSLALTVLIFVLTEGVAYYQRSSGKRLDDVFAAWVRRHAGK